MKITNLTRYLTRDVRSLILRAFKEFDRKPADYAHVRVRVAYNHGHNPGWHGGCARYGRKVFGEQGEVIGRKLGGFMRLTLPRDPKLANPAQFGATSLHEIAHLLGRRHKDMEPTLLYGKPEIAPWAVGMPLGLKPERPPKAKPGPADKAAKARAKIEAIEKKIKRLRKRWTKLAAQVRYYDRKEAVAALAPPPAESSG